MRGPHLLFTFFILLGIFILFLKMYSTYTFCKNNFRNEVTACMVSSRYNIGTIKK